MSFSQQIKFSDLTRLLEHVVTTKAMNKRDEYVRDYFQKLHKFREEFIRKDPDKDSSLLPVLRLFLAQEEKERSYGLAEKTLRLLYIKALKLHKNSSDADKLMKCSEGDLPNKIGEVMKTRTADGTLTIYDVDNALNSISANQKQSEQENELRRLIFKSSAIDQKWISKMILKRMQMNIGATKILRFYHPKAPELFLKYAHLSKVVELVESNQVDEALEEVTRVFEPIRSMLSQKFTSTSNKDVLQNELYQETKMDGERFQLHMKNNEFRYYSRNGHEYSEGYNILVTPLIKFTAVVHSIILDGEMLVYDKIEKRYHTKGETAHDVKHMKDRNSNLQPCFCAFDVLLYNDKSMLNRPYLERSQLLAQLFQDREGVLVKTKPVKVRDADHIVELFNIAINHSEEGIILKDAKSIYKPGERFGGWYKVKPDYFDGELVKDFDCIIVGCSYENRHSKNFIQRYMLGAIEKLEDGTFNIFAVAEVTHGLTVLERSKLNESLKPHLVDFNYNETEVSFDHGKIFFGRQKPHTWIPPNKSIVLECRVAELQPSNDFKADVTFRFPRIANVRRDKIWDESCTMQEIQDMRKENSTKVQKTVIRQVNRDDLVSPTRKRKSNTSVASIISKLRNAADELSDVKAVDNVMEGKEFCVLTTSKKLPSIKEMKTMVLQHSGSITEFPRKGKTFALIVGEMTKMVKSYMNEKVYNVVKAEWLVENFKDGAVHMDMPKIRPVIDLYFATETMKKSLRSSYDEFGDSYTEPFETVEQLKGLLSTMQPLEGAVDLTELDDELLALGMENRNFMRNISACFWSLQNDSVAFESSKLILKLRGGRIIEETTGLHNEAIIIVDQREDIDNLMEVARESFSVVGDLVDFHWIIDSNDAGKVLEKNKYVIKRS